MQNLKWDTSRAASFRQTAEQFRDQIWVIVENWMQRLASEGDENVWGRIPETQLVDNLPTLLRGVSKVIENPKRLSDFSPEGVIYEAAAELGRNRQLLDYKPSEILREQEVLREIIWRFCAGRFTAIDAYELEQRINRPLDKMTATVTENYINAYAGELKQLARRDRLTGLLNYESFKETIAEELKRSRRYRRSFSLILVDIDGCKDYNDRFGAAAADTLIQEVAKIVAHSIRGVDIPVRYGADEFAVIVPEAGKKQARRAAERLRRAVKLETRHSAEVRRTLKSAVTVSVGISSYPKDAELVDAMISLADEALYEAKEAGKDMVVEVDSKRKR